MGMTTNVKVFGLMMAGVICPCGFLERNLFLTDHAMLRVYAIKTKIIAITTSMFQYHSKDYLIGRQRGLLMFRFSCQRCLKLYFGVLPFRSYPEGI